MAAAARLLRQLSQCPFSSAAQLSWGGGGGHGDYKKLIVKEEGGGEADDHQRGDDHSDIAAAAQGRRAACSCSKRKQKKKKRGDDHGDIAAAAEGRWPACGCSKGKQKKKKRGDDHGDIAAAAEGGPAYICSKKKTAVPKGYLPVLVMGNVEEEEDDDDQSRGDVSGCLRGKCDVSGGFGHSCWHVYVIRVRLLGHPLLDDLLTRSCQHFGYSQYPGALRLPCDSHTFEHLLTLIK